MLLSSNKIQQDSHKHFNLFTSITYHTQFTVCCHQRHVVDNSLTLYYKTKVTKYLEMHHQSQCPPQNMSIRLLTTFARGAAASFFCFFFNGVFFFLEVVFFFEAFFLFPLDGPASSALDWMVQHHHLSSSCKCTFH